MKFHSDRIDWGTINLGKTYEKPFEIYNPDSIAIHLRITNCIPGIRAYSNRSKEWLSEGVDIAANPIDTLIFVFVPVDTNTLGTVCQEFILEVDHVVLFPHLLMNAKIIENFASDKDHHSPRIDIPGESWNFGIIKPGQKSKHTFRVMNKGDENLIIRKIETSCGCTAAILGQRIIAPGQETTLEVQFKSAGKRGKQIKNIEVFCNDPHHPIKKIQIRGEIETNYH